MDYAAITADKATYDSLIPCEQEPLELARVDDLDICQILITAKGFNNQQELSDHLALVNQRFGREISVKDFLRYGMEKIMHSYERCGDETCY
jgi:uncharacterized protein YqjF (DUF2071 family)